MEQRPEFNSFGLGNSSLQTRHHARSYVFVRDHDRAFPLLVECAKAGYFSAASLRRDLYLTELHDDPRFQDVLDAIEQPWPEPVEREQPEPEPPSE